MLTLLLFINLALAEVCENQAVSSVQSVRDISCHIARAPIEEYVKKADPCLLSELSQGDVYHTLISPLGGFMSTAEMTSQKLRELAGEVVRPTRFNKLYTSPVNRPELREFFNGLADHLEKNGITRFYPDQIISSATFRIEAAKKNGEVGECYNLQSFGGPKYIFASISRNQTVSVSDQKKIEEIMSEAQNRPYHFGEMDGELFKNKRLSIEELKELKALREASAAFEKATFLKNDEAGGFISNIKGEFGGGDQVNCVLEAQNHRVFLNKLKDKGLLKNFEVSGEAKRPMEYSKKDLTASGHIAILLKNKRTGEEFVYDSWFEKGGEAAHILSRRDWNNLSLDLKNNFNDVVPLTPEASK